MRNTFSLANISPQVGAGFNRDYWARIESMVRNLVVEYDELFIKRFDNDLCNNLIDDFNKFISKENLQKVNKISVSIGPANFNASRLIVVLARTISQQIDCEAEQTPEDEPFVRFDGTLLVTMNR